ncbi:MAG TPA: hypothetical protein VF574_08780 [Allosphingosinicella sp.]|jgi:hypothetical protein
MRGMVGSIGQGRAFVSLLLALLLLSRLLIPSGYMIAPDHRGRPALVLCGVPARPAAKPVSHGGHGGGSADQSPSRPGERPCPFAALAAPPLPPAPPAVPPRALAAIAPPDVQAATELVRVAPAAPPPPATGPPLSV